MKTKCLLVMVFICRCLFSQTSVPAGNVNGTWTQAGSPYNIQGDIQIPNNDSLIIQPGVTVSFQGMFRLAVLGKLKAIGTPTDTIRFISGLVFSGWKGIEFNNTLSSNDSSKLIYCRLQNGEATDPSPGDKGGAVYVSGFSKSRVSRCLIKSCTAKTSGGAIYLNSSNAILSANRISSNYSSFGGGVSTSSGTPVISYNLISNNFTGNGGGVYIHSGSAFIVGNTISNNSAQDFQGGGGIRIDPVVSGTVAIKGNKILNNMALYGGGISSSSNGFVTISSNTISGNGGGIAAGIFVDGKALITGNVISANTANGSGGGIGCGKEAITISYNFICNNFAPAPQNEGGGGIYFFESDSTTKVHNNVIANNGASSGAGIFCAQASPLLISNTIVNNKAGAKGGGLYCFKSNP